MLLRQKQPTCVDTIVLKVTLGTPANFIRSKKKKKNFLLEKLKLLFVFSVMTVAINPTVCEFLTIQGMQAGNLTDKGFLSMTSFCEFCVALLSCLWTSSAAIHCHM